MRLTRIWFSKKGRAKYISHLDLYRTFTRAVRRAGIPLWYTEGFNTHPYITIALPLAIMQESDREAVDIRIENDMTNEEIKEKLTAVCPEGIEIIDVRKPWDDPKKIAFADYTVMTQFANSDDAKKYEAHILKALKDSELLVEKMGKKNGRKVMKEVNILPMVNKTELALKGCELRIKMTVAAGSTNNLNPALFIDAVSKKAELKPLSVNIIRNRLLTENLKEFE